MNASSVASKTFVCKGFKSILTISEVPITTTNAPSAKTPLKLIKTTEYMLTKYIKVFGSIDVMTVTKSLTHFKHPGNIDLKLTNVNNLLNTLCPPCVTFVAKS